LGASTLTTNNEEGNRHASATNFRTSDSGPKPVRNGTQGVQNLQRAAQQKQILANDLRMRCLRSVQDAPKERSGYFAQRKPDRVCQVAGSKPRRVHAQSKNRGSGEGLQGLCGCQLKCHVRLLRISWPSVYMTIQSGEIRQDRQSF